ncbi:BtpA/SgcQ family protein [Haloprofundus salilacus]|uniref:BtpA/SgcQ family protein n=1 Tax=Haloprofundus salilacus TaxID=2876190 RepID=UPI001CCD7DDB|nr:BtpA/SgcQ family protein [Haloprofundus salilacus]
MNDFLSLDAPVVGMVHLPPLPGAPEFAGDRAELRERALRDAAALESGGVDAVMVENFGDAPFHPDDVPKHTVASMTALVGAVRGAVSVPVGVNVLRNDAAAALSVAAATGASFVRVNVHTGARVTDQGVVTGRAHETMRLRDRLDTDVAVLADIDVKHSAPVTPREMDEVVAETLDRGLADGVVVSGVGTGEAVDREALGEVVARRDELALDAPVVVGSGTTVENVSDLLDVADGIIIGTALKRGGETTNPVDETRVRELIEAVES